MHYCITFVKTELDQLLEGLDALDILKLIRANPSTFRQLFVHEMKIALSADHFLSLYTETFSPSGSNKREAEEAAMIMWIHFIEQIGI